MVTNFFQTLAGLAIQSDWNITVKKDGDGKLVISVLIKNNNVKDEAAKVIPPIVLIGTPEQLDNGFFGRIAEPVKKTDQLFCNMEAYSKAQENVKKQSKAEQGKADIEKKEKESKKKTFDDLMKKVSELEEAKNYEEAIANLPNAKEFPEYATEISKRNVELMQKKINISLF